MENKEQFLKELAELSMKHGIVIGGCGCCGSPFLMKSSSEGHYTVDDYDSSLSFQEK